MLAILGLLCLPLPLLLAANNGGYLWTDALEIGERAIVRGSLHDLIAAIVGGIEGHYYRPTIFVLHSFDFVLFGDRPAAFRLTNFVLHEVNVLLVYRLVRRLWSDQRAAFVAAALFAVHPLAATPLVWISDRTDLVALMASLGFFSFCLAYLECGTVINLFAAAGSLLLGLGAKETVAATILVSLACLPRFSPRAGMLRLAKVIVVQVLTSAAWFAWRHHVATNSVQYVGQLAVFDRLGLASRIHLEYVRQLLEPYTLTVCDGMHLPSQGIAWIMGALLALAGIGVVAWLALKRRDHSVALAIVWLISFLVPSSGIVPLKHIRADRYLYCALPALTYLLARGIRSLSARVSGRSALANALFLIAYVSLSGSLFLRGRRFANDASLWTYETNHDDACLEGYSYLAHSALADGNPTQALAYADKAARVAPDVIAYVDSDATTYLRALILVELGDMTAATAVLMRLMDGSDNRALRAESSYELGLIAIQQNDYQAGVDDMNRALQIGASQKSTRDIILLRCYAYLHLGNRDACRRDFAQIEALTPDDLDPVREQVLKEVRAGLAN